jgi:Cdc6-like AAA superfamily ATPase
MIPNLRAFKGVYLQRELIHSESKVGQFSRAFQPALTGSATHNALIGGVSSVGKTALARHTLNIVEERASVSYAHIRCLSKSTGATLREVLRQHPAEISK